MSEFRPINECFCLSNEIRAQHLLWQDFLKERTDLDGRRGYKIAFYIWLQKNEMKAKRGKDTDGSFGFGLRYIERKGGNHEASTNI